MDGDPYVEPDLDAFSRVLPLPFRVAIILVLGVWAWGANLDGLHRVKIDVPALIRYPQRASHLHPPHHRTTYHLASTLSIPLAALLVLFWLLTRGRPQAVLDWQILPNLYLLVFVLLFAVPTTYVTSRSGRYRTVATLRRVSVGGLAEVQDGKFGDILMADVLTSYAKVFGDLFVALCMFFTWGHSTARPDRHCGGVFMVPLIISIPSAIRLRQCLIEFLRVRRANVTASGIAANTSNGWGGQHLANALKYASAFPVVLFSSLQRDHDADTVWFDQTTLYRLWLIAIFINSFYSFYWDVAKDWDLSLFSRSRADPEHPWGLRRRRFYPDRVYYIVIVLDLFLRCTWSLKLSPHLDHFNDLEGSIFVMEVLEVIRRWVWVFFRVETEWVRNNHGPAPDDVLLGGFDRHDQSIFEPYEDD